MFLKYNKKVRESEVNANDGVIKLDAKIQDFSLENVDENSFIIQKGILQEKAHAVREKNKIYVWYNNAQYIFEVTEKEFSDSSDIGVNIDREIIFAPMPGTIVKVLKNIGDEVVEGTAVLIIEAMKMETTLYSSISGIIKKIDAIPGSQVDTDVALILIEK